MKAFRVRDVGQVDSAIAWKGMDGTAFVLVGGTNRPYITVSPELATASEREGRVSEVDYVLDGAGGLVLVPTKNVEDKDGSRARCALIVIPTGGFDFRFSRDQSPIQPRYSNVCRVVVLAPGESITAFPHVQTMRDADSARLLALRFDGDKVTFDLAGE